MPLSSIGRIANRSPAFRYFEGNEKSLGRRQVGNQTYQVTEIEDVLVPLKPGELTVPPHKLQVQVVERRRVDDFFGGFGRGIFDFGFSQTVPLDLESEPITIEVKRPPKKGQPASYDGVVGSFSVTGEVSGRQITKGESVTVQVTFAGAGLLGSVTPPQLPVASFAKVYEDSPVYREEPGGTDVLKSSKTFNIAVVPNRTGTFPLGVVSLPVFNPKTESYEVLQTDLGSIEVVDGPNSIAGSQAPVGSQNQSGTATGSATDPASPSLQESSTGHNMAGPEDNGESDQTLEGFRVNLLAEDLELKNQTAAKAGAIFGISRFSLLIGTIALLPLLAVLGLWLAPMIGGSSSKLGQSQAKKLRKLKKQVAEIIEQHSHPRGRETAIQHLEQLIKVTEDQLGSSGEGPLELWQVPTESLKQAYLASKTLRETLQFGNQPYDSQQLTEVHNLWRQSLQDEGLDNAGLAPNLNS